MSGYKYYVQVAEETKECAYQWLRYLRKVIRENDCWWFTKQSIESCFGVGRVERARID